MAKRKKIPQKLQIWVEVRKKYHLSHAHIQMARELGLNPKKFGKLAKHEPWKAPLPVFIENIYYKRFKKPRPDRVLSIEQLFKERQKKKADRKTRKRMQKQNGFVSESNQTMV